MTEDMSNAYRNFESNIVLYLLDLSYFIAWMTFVLLTTHHGASFSLVEGLSELFSSRYQQP